MLEQVRDVCNSNPHNINHDVSKKDANLEQTVIHARGAKCCHPFCECMQRKLPMFFLLGTAFSASGGALSITIARRLEDLALIKSMQFSISNV